MIDTTGQVSEATLLPAGLLVEGLPAQIADAFAALCALQPIRMDEAGLVCAPRCAPELAAPALARCPLPVRPLAQIPGWPDPPSAMVSGWYRRSPDHMPAPEGIRELIQTTGEGFGPAGHATSAMCLGALERLSAGPAIDVGCGSGLLAQAWAALGRGDVLACDLDPRAIDQSRRSLAAAGLADRVTLRHGPIGTLAPSETAGRTILANIPLPAHESLLARLGEGPPVAAVLSGLRPAQTAGVVDAYRALGLQVLGSRERAGFTCTWLARP